MADPLVLDFVESIMFVDEPEGESDHIKWFLTKWEPLTTITRLRMIFPMSHEIVSRGLHASFCEEVLTTLFSETSNDDACFVTLRIRSAHFDLYKDIPQWIKDAPFGSWIVVDGVVRDYLT